MAQFAAVAASVVLWSEKLLVASLGILTIYIIVSVGKRILYKVMNDTKN